MRFITIILGSILAILSATVLAYISMATMVGPWIAPTIVLVTSFILKLISTRKNFLEQTILIQSIASGGGVIAVGIGFALPILHFLDPHIFDQWLYDHTNFCTLVSVTCLSAGCTGIFLGRFFAQKIDRLEKLPFPVSQLTYKTATSQTHKKQGRLFLQGSSFALLISFLRDGFGRLQAVLPKHIDLFPSLFGQEFALSLWPTLWAIGYTTGISIALPLLIGVASKYLILTPLNNHSLIFCSSFFEPLEDIAFATAFCSGLVLAEVLFGIIKQVMQSRNSFSKYLASVQELPNLIRKVVEQTHDNKPQNATIWGHISRVIAILEPIACVTSFSAIFSYLGFSPQAQCCFFIFTAIATYEICRIGCEIGLVQFGRFSAFVLIPMMLLFKINFVQITAVCVFFNICAAAASDLLFDYKTASFCNIERSKIHIAQWIGLIATAVSIGFILHLLFTELTLGSAELFAHRGRSKALLIKSLNLNGYIVFCGFLYGLILRRCKISPAMTLGGIIMPNNITFGLIIGGIINYITSRNHITYMPFFSGIFASETLWIIISLVLKII